MEEKEQLRTYLQTLDEYHKSIEHCGLPAFLLAHGVWFEGRASSTEYDLAKKWKRKQRPEAQQCFYNAQLFCIENEGARYYEGYIGSLGNQEHGWNVMPDGRVVDFTLEAMERVAKKQGLKCDTKGMLYFGLEVPREVVLVTALRKVAYEPMAEEYYRGLVMSIPESE